MCYFSPCVAPMYKHEIFIRWITVALGDLFIYLFQWVLYRFHYNNAVLGFNCFLACYPLLPSVTLRFKTISISFWLKCMFSCVDQVWWRPCLRAGTAFSWTCRTVSTRSLRASARSSTAYILPVWMWAKFTVCRSDRD